MRLFVALAALVIVSACSISQHVTPVTIAPTASPQICIIEHPATRDSFLDAYQRALQERGFETRVLPEGTSIHACPVTTTYIARWSWDFTIYMRFAELQVYHNGRNAGRAVYDTNRP